LQKPSPPTLPFHFVPTPREKIPPARLSTQQEIEELEKEIFEIKDTFQEPPMSKNRKAIL